MAPRPPHFAVVNPGKVRFMLPIIPKYTVMRFKYSFQLFALSQLFLVTLLSATPKPLKAAIFVQNRETPVLDSKVQVLEDLITSRISELGVSVYSRDVIMNSINNYLGVEAQKQITEDEQKENVQNQYIRAATSTQGLMNRLDRELNESTSALRLAQQLGVDYILMAAFTALTTDLRRTNSYGAERTVATITLRIAYKLVDASMGGSLAGDTIKVSKKLAVSENLSIDVTKIQNTRDKDGQKQERTDDSEKFVLAVADDLLDEASLRIVENIGRKIEHDKIPEVVKNNAQVNVTIQCTSSDLSFPSLTKNASGEYVVTDIRKEMPLGGVAVELDGLVIGTAPGTFSVLPGIHKLRLVREDFQEWIRTVNFYEGFKLNATLIMKETTKKKMDNDFRMLEGLKKDQKLTDAEVKRLEGLAKMFGQSYFKLTEINDTMLNDPSKITPVIINNSQNQNQQPEK